MASPEATIIECSTSEVLLQLRSELPAAAFQRTPTRYLVLIAHAFIVFSSFHFAAVHPAWWLIAVAMIVAGHSLVCIGFLAHDLTHGSILANGVFRKTSETGFWALTLISRTIWRKVHNQSHHAHYGTINDPDRQFVESERGILTWIYSFLFVPNADATIGNPIIFAQTVYNLRNLLAALSPGETKPAFVPAKPDYSTKEKMLIFLDLTVMSAIQFGLFAAVGFNLTFYLLLALGAYTFASGLSIFYILTNHALNPVRETPDLLEGCTSVIVPRWIDRLHSYFSFHTEHHLFPALNPKYYPQVSHLIAEKFPDQYQRVPIITAWRLLWKRPMFDKDPAAVPTAKTTA